MTDKLQHLQSLACKFAQSGKFIGWRQIEFELKFEKGFELARMASQARNAGGAEAALSGSSDLQIRSCLTARPPHALGNLAA